MQFKKNVILFLIKHSLFNYSVIFPVIADVYIIVYISIITVQYLLGVGIEVETLI